MAIREFMGLDIPAFKRFYKVSYKTVQSSRLDTTAIKARFPELVQQFMKTVSCKRFTIS